MVLGIKTSKGIIAITVRSHTGILKITRTMQRITKEKIYALLGGFHLFRSSVTKINNIANGLKNEDVEFVALCHCTGEGTLKIFGQRFGGRFLQNFVGSEYLFEVWDFCGGIKKHR